MTLDRRDPDAVRAEINRLRHSNNPWDHKRADELVLGPLREANQKRDSQPDHDAGERVDEMSGRNAAENWENH